MLLLPPPDVQDTRPLYHISVSMNCFIPSSYITTLRRGANEYGDLVAEFEYVFGLSDCSAFNRDDHIEWATQKISTQSQFMGSSEPLELS